jgi:antirestriction protein ArdC
MRAASQASKAADYLLGFVPEPIVSGWPDSVVADYQAA